MYQKIRTAAFAVLALMFSTSAMAQECTATCCKGGNMCPHMQMSSQEHHDHAGHVMAAEKTAVQDIYAPAMDKMMKDMPAATGDADADFMREMIVHHQAAIDMANVALAKAQNDDVRTLANNILTAQKGEIAFMTEWLRSRDISVK